MQEGIKRGRPKMKWLDLWSALKKRNERSSAREMKFRTKRKMKRRNETKVQGGGEENRKTKDEMIALLE